MTGLMFKTASDSDSGKTEAEPYADEPVGLRCEDP